MCILGVGGSSYLLVIMVEGYATGTGEGDWNEGWVKDGVTER